MKTWLTMLLALIIALALILCSCNYISSNVVTLHLSQTVCQLALNGVTPEEFCSTRGNDTYIKGKYLSANVDEDGCLILKVNSGVIKEWKAGLGHDKSAFRQGFQLVRCHQRAFNHLQRARSFAFALCDRTGERRSASHCFGENLCRFTVGCKTAEHRQLCVVDNDLRAFLAVVFL